jgi:ADP-ribosylglycohydrolase
MIGAIAGDIIGSVYEFHNYKRTDFPLFDPRCQFTDDTVLTVAVADCLLHGGDYAAKFKEYYRLYPGRGYGVRFRRWAASDRALPYRSTGNGSAMRVSPVGFAFSSLEAVLDEARKSAEVTHNTEEGIAGAQSVAGAIFLARAGKAKAEIKKFVETNFGYDLSEPLRRIRPNYRHDETCSGSVPQAITAFLESRSFVDAIRKAVSIGGDSDTIACIAGGIARAFYKKIPRAVEKKVMAILDERLRGIVLEFMAKYPG